ncbi:MAG: hypothetical protein WAM14_02355 [Candidatus Nitrosopolaris sp.]
MEKVKRVETDQRPLINTLSIFVPFGWDETRDLCMPLTATERTGGR